LRLSAKSQNASISRMNKSLICSWTGRTNSVISLKSIN